MFPEPALVWRQLSVRPRAPARCAPPWTAIPNSGALSLEWIVIASILVIAAVAAGVFFTSKITAWEGKVP